MASTDRTRLARARKLSVAMITLHAHSTEAPADRTRRLRASPLIEMCGEIDEKLGASVCRKLDALKGSPSILMWINSPGGSVVEAGKICSALDRLTDNGCVVSAHAQKDCSSAAMAVFLRATERTAASGTRLLVHRAALPIGLSEYRNAADLRRIINLLEDEDRAALHEFEGRLGRAMPRFMRRDFLRGKDIRISQTVARDLGLVHGFSSGIKSKCT